MSEPKEPQRAAIAFIFVTLVLDGMAGGSAIRCFPS